MQCLKKRLRYLNFPVDRAGYFGYRTVDAVKQIKRRAGLLDNGVAGAAALDRIYDPHRRPIRSWGHCITRKLSPETTHYQVGCLKRRLRNLNFPIDRAPHYGYRTADAVRQLKRTVGLRNNGVAGPAALSAIYSQRRQPVRVWGHCITRGLDRGGRGYQVKCLQTRLRRLNLLADVDGDYGTLTAGAVNSMKRRAGLNPNGFAGRAALNRIFSARLPAPIQYGHDETGHALSTVSVAGPWAPQLPAGSGVGLGKRIVYSRAYQRAWAVGADEHIVRSWLVSGSLYDNEVPGVHHVFSKSRYAYAYTGSGVVLPNMVRYYTTPNGNNIGFHAIPLSNGYPIMTESELGTPRSAGCTRQANNDASFLWDWAPVGTPVVVT